MAGWWWRSRCARGRHCRHGQARTIWRVFSTLFLSQEIGWNMGLVCHGLSKIGYPQNPPNLVVEWCWIPGSYTNCNILRASSIFSLTYSSASRVAPCWYSFGSGADPQGHERGRRHSTKSDWLDRAALLILPSWCLASATKWWKIGRARRSDSGSRSRSDSRSAECQPEVYESLEVDAC